MGPSAQTSAAAASANSATSPWSRHYPSIQPHFFAALASFADRLLFPSPASPPQRVSINSTPSSPCDSECASPPCASLMRRRTSLAESAWRSASS
jgi:hypothetical protein